MIKKADLYFFILFGSLIAFLAKGIFYAIIGSYLPIILALAITVSFLLTRDKTKYHNIIIKIWAISLIIWSILRIVIGVLNHFVKPLTENHLQQQLGIQGMIISIIILVFGIFLLKKKTRNNWLQTEM
tara:strand:+ start:19479 stop:19862 length:384 start_codon:yes stop_codon:yes gene_type:complete